MYMATAAEKERDMATAIISRVTGLGDYEYEHEHEMSRGGNGDGGGGNGDGRVIGEGEQK